MASRDTHEYLEIVGAPEKVARKTHSYIETTYRADNHSKYTQEYIEVVLKVGAIPDDVAGVHWSAPAPNVSGFGAGPTVDPSPPSGANIVHEGETSSVDLNRLYRLTYVGLGVFTSTDPPALTFPTSYRPLVYAWSFDGKYLAVSSNAYEPPLVLFPTDTLVGFIGPIPANAPTALVWSHNSTMFAAYHDGATHVYSVPTAPTTTWTELATFPEVCHEFSSSDDRLACISGQDVVIYETTTWTIDHTQTVPAGAVTRNISSLSWRPPNDEYLAIVANNEWYIYETTSWTLSGSPDVSENATGGGFLGPSYTARVGFSPAGDRIAVSGSRGLFNTARTRVYNFPAFTSVLNSSRGDGDAREGYFGWGDGGGVFGYQFGSANSPGHIVGIGSISGPGSGTGKRGLQWVMGPTNAGWLEAWGVVLF